SPTDPNFVIAGGVNYVVSTDGGQTWSTTNFGNSGVHVDAHDLRFDAGGLLYIANDGGVWTSADLGAHATARNTRLATRQFYFVATDPATRTRIFGGLQDTGTIRRSDDAGTEWATMIGGDGIECVVNPAAPSYFIGSIQNALLRRTTNAGAANPAFRAVTPLYPSAHILPFRTLIKRDPVNPAVYYTVSHRVWKSGDGGASWLPLPIATTDGPAWPTNRSIVAMSIAASRPEVMMVALPGTFVFRTTDGGQTWTRTVTGLPNRVATSI